MRTTPRVIPILKQASSAARLHQTLAQKLVLTAFLVFDFARGRFNVSHWYTIVHLGTQRNAEQTDHTKLSCQPASFWSEKKFWAATMQQTIRTSQNWKESGSRSTTKRRIRRCSSGPERWLSFKSDEGKH